ncbi:MAG: carboxylesterase family protein [Eubacteriales bacterium]|nr:carboxylesterase family protein [Eubacteriales bacterium]
MRDDERSIIPSDVGQAIADRSPDVDLMIGTVGDEIRYWIDEMGMDSDDENVEVFYDFVLGKFASYKEKFPELVQDLETALAISDPVQDSKYSAMYPGIWEYADIASEVSFRVPSLDIVEKRLAAGGDGKTYMYQFDKRGTTNDFFGACHACELCYVFNNTVFDYMTGRAEPKLAADVSAAWVAFARTGDPSTEAHAWPQYDTEVRPVMVMNDDSTMGIVNDPKSAMRELLSEILIF